MFIFALVKQPLIFNKKRRDKKRQQQFLGENVLFSWAHCWTNPVLNVMHQVKYNLSLKLPGFKILFWNSEPGFLSSRTFKWQRVIVSIPVIYNKWLSVRYLLLDGVCICFVLCGLNSEQNKCGGGSLKVKALPMYILVHSYFFLLFLLLEIDFIYQITRTWRIHIKEISDIRIEHTKRQKVFHQPACQRATPHLLNLYLGCNQLVQELETADCPYLW